MNTIKSLHLIALLATSPLALATGDHAHQPHEQSLPHSSSQTVSTQLSEGEIRKIDTTTGKITIKHGPLPNLDMPPMTMAFRVKDMAWLQQLKVGDKLGFQAENVNGALTVVRYELVK